MFITKVALAAALALGSTSFACAEALWGSGGQDANLGNRIPVLNEPGVYGYGVVGGLRMLLPKRPTEETAQALAQGSGRLRSAAVSLTARRTGALRSAPVSLDDQQGSLVQAAVAAVYPETGTGVGGTLRGLRFSARTGIYREDVVALGLARLYGGGAASTQTAPVGMYGGGYGLRTAGVGIGRASPVTRMYRRAAFRGTAVGLRRGIGAGSVEPISGGGGY
ncbi:MAG: hypothetical protein E6G97_23565 [Alphaproteobacteria bacterium]|nr:MAG: hypothetical protein E6G97_23565 [Alphaproteobacteria bacterium]